MPRASLAALFVALLVALVTPPASAQTDPAAQREKVRQQAADVAAQVDALDASAADVNQALDALQANVAGLDANLAEAQLIADQTAAVLQQAMAEQHAAEARVAQLLTLVRAIAVDSYVHAGTATVAEEPRGGNIDAELLRNTLAGFKADHDQSVIEQLRIAQRELELKRKNAEEAFAAAEERRTDAAARADEAHRARDQQAAFVRQVEKRLDAKLAEARTLASLDKKFSAQIDAEARALADRVSKERPPPPPGNWPVPARPGPPPEVATTHGITVAKSIVEQTGAMLRKAEADGMHFTGSGWRSYDSQVSLRQQNCGTTSYDIYYRPSSECSPPTARPGFSMHEQGLAIDFAESGSVLTSHEDRGWVWLNANALAFGFANLDVEPWHWSTTGA
jgi:hypothetical protein